MRSEFEKKEVRVFEQAKLLAQLAKMTIVLGTKKEKNEYQSIMQQANEYRQEDVEEFYEYDEDNNLDGMRDLIDNNFREYWGEFARAKAILERIYYEVDSRADYYADLVYYNWNLLYPE